MDIAANFKSLSGEMPPGVRIVAVTKTHEPPEIMQLYETGHRLMGENKVQELTGKKDSLPADISWHMVGHLQSNKVRYIAPFISMIHSVDSGKLLSIISKEAVRNNRVIDCLLQVHIAMEETKFGFSEDEVLDLLRDLVPGDYPGVSIRGLMGMATFTGDEDQVRSEFRSLNRLFRHVRDSSLPVSPGFNELSMGMSGDFRIAIEEGSTLVRIGSLIFGERDYN
jgi:PLP dependent protein